jgi:hypothetical protein
VVLRASAYALVVLCVASCALVVSFERYDDAPTLPVDAGAPDADAEAG